jgi:hypothetical protein
MPTICSIEEFVQEITKAIQAASPEEKRQFREAWLAQYDRSFLRLTGMT